MEWLEPLEEIPDDVSQRYGVFDLETLAPENAQVWAVGYRDERGYKRFDVLDANSSNTSVPFAPEDRAGPLNMFLQFVFAERHGRTLYAHNGGNFDCQYVARWLIEHGEEWGLTAQIIPLSSSIMAMLVKANDGREWKILDSMRILPMSLEKVAKTFGLEGKFGGEHDEAYYATLHKNPERYKYLAQDVDILYRAISRYSGVLRKLGSTVAISAASTAMRLFRAKFQKKSIRINRHFDECEKPEGPGEGHCVGCLHDFAREAYYGGRVEVFNTAPFVSEVDVYYGDINSMYPAAMMGPMPTGRMRVSRDIDNGQKDEVGFFEVTVSIPRDCPVPPLPFRFEGSGLLFPTGVFRGVWDHCELELLQRVGGTVQEVHRGVWIEARSDLANYVTTLYGFRDKSRADYNEGRAAIAKILLNSLYGKFGSDYDRESIWINPSVEEISENHLRDMCDRYHTLFVEDVHVYPDYLVPQIAAHITALARRNLWVYLDAANRGGKLFYCDTDSIISTHKYDWSSDLGGMKLEKVARSGHFVAPKLYRFGDTTAEEFVKAKGFGGFGRKVDSAAWREIVAGVEFVSGRMAKLKGWSKAGDTPRVHSVGKQRRTGYTKRFVYPDGSTRPWHIDNGVLT